MNFFQKVLFLSIFSLIFSGCEFSDKNIQAIEDIIEISEESVQEKPENSNPIPHQVLSKTLKKEEYQETPKENQEASDKNLYTIDYVYDGDTYMVWVDGKKEKIRVLGIDTPEKKGGFRPEGCFGGHASIYAKQKLLGKKIGLLKPKSHESRDKYGRILRYVFLDGKDFGAHLIEEGYAFSYKRFSHPRLKYYNQLEKQAQKNKKGMWNPDNCDYWGQNNLID